LGEKLQNPWFVKGKYACHLELQCGVQSQKAFSTGK
jgi:hypothetical protein